MSAKHRQQNHRQEADYVGVFAAEQKANSFKDTTASRHETVDADHGRIETRTYTAIHDAAWLQKRHGLAGLWENWRDPVSEEWVRTFTIITVPSNELIARIHDRMPAILQPADYERWLGSEPDPHDLLIMFPSEPMNVWPI